MAVSATTAPRRQPARVVTWVSSAVERALEPLDGLRRVLFQLLGSRFNRALIVPRQRRVALYGVLLGLVALIGAATLPVWMIALGPLLLGVPHVVSDIRYLVVRPGLSRRRWRLLLVLGVMGSAPLGLGVRGGILAVAVAVLLAECAAWRKAMALPLCAALYYLCHRAGWLADAALVHLHNVVAVVLWCAWWRRGEGKLRWAPLAVFVAGGALILGGAADPIVTATGGLWSHWTGLTPSYLTATLAPFAGGAMAMRFVLFYAFAQSIHYTVWLRLVPEEARPRSTPRGFRQSYRALLAEVGPWVLLAAAVTSLVFIAWAFVSVARARTMYLEVAFFHVYLELVVLALFWVEDRWPVEIAYGRRAEQEDDREAAAAGAG